VKIGIFDPYLDTLGGGERYILTLASCLAKENQVEIFWDNPEQIKKSISLLNIDISKFSFRKNIFLKSSLIDKLLITRKYDCIIYMSDGSIPFLFGKKNILLFQFPVNWVNGVNLLTKMKFKFISHVICYSDFVKKYLDSSFKIDSKVIVPPVNIEFDSVKKENIILSVGRFTKGMNTKKQKFLIDEFKKHSAEEFKGWKLVLVGSSLPHDQDFVSYLKSEAKGFPIQILDNLEYNKTRDLYSKAKIYWHAAGFGEDLNTYPERAEHFGISVVEAGAVPVVVNAGGLKEIVNDKKDGYLWSSPAELFKITLELINDSGLLKKTSENAIKESQKYSEEKFCEKVRSIIY